MLSGSADETELGRLLGVACRVRCNDRILGAVRARLKPCGSHIAMRRRKASERAFEFVMTRFWVRADRFIRAR